MGPKRPAGRHLQRLGSPITFDHIRLRPFFHTQSDGDHSIAAPYFLFRVLRRLSIFHRSVCSVISPRNISPVKRDDWNSSHVCLSRARTSHAEHTVDHGHEISTLRHGPTPECIKCSLHSHSVLWTVMKRMLMYITRTYRILMLTLLFRHTKSWPWKSIEAEYFIFRAALWEESGQLIAHLNNVQRPCQHVTRAMASFMTYGLTLHPIHDPSFFFLSFSSQIFCRRYSDGLNIAVSVYGDIRYFRFICRQHFFFLLFAVDCVFYCSDRQWER